MPFTQPIGESLLPNGKEVLRDFSLYPHGESYEN